jgi:hypothetical protein
MREQSVRTSGRRSHTARTTGRRHA